MNTKSIIDVRTPEEFAVGHVKGSKNIPLQEIRKRLAEIKDLEKPVIVCSARGKRSAAAEEFLVKHRVRCINAGSWIDVGLFIKAIRALE